MEKWIARNFQVIEEGKAIEWGLTHVCNVYGDMINRMNCRSFWKDNKGRHYRVRQLNQIGL